MRVPRPTGVPRSPDMICGWALVTCAPGAATARFPSGGTDETVTRATVGCGERRGMDTVKHVGGALVAAAGWAAVIESVWRLFGVASTYGPPARPVHVAALIGVPAVVFVGCMLTPPGRRR